MFRIFIPVALAAPFLLWWIFTWGMPLPWLLIPLCWMVGLAVLTLICFVLTACVIGLYEHVWEKGYVKWKKELDLPPNEYQKELVKIIKVIERHKKEYHVRENNPTAAKIWEEYQIILALTDGVQIAEEIEFMSSWYERCLKSNSDLK